MTHFSKRRKHKFLVIPLTIEESMKRSFKGETVHDPEFLPKNHSCCFKLTFLYPELARVESKHFGDFTEYFREHTHFKVSFIMQRVVRSIEKDRFLPAMAMHINERTNTLGFLRLCLYSSYKVFNCTNSGM